MIFLWVLVVLEMMVLLQGLLALIDGILTARDMLWYLGEEGIPFNCHEGMWGDFFLISPLIAIIMQLYWSSLTFDHCCIAAFVGIITSFGMHSTYKRIPWPETHVQYNVLTPAGVIHAIYMTIVVTIFLLFFFATSNPGHNLLWIASAVLTFHMILGTHVPLGIIKPKWYPGDPLRSWSKTWIPILVVALATFGRTLYLVTH